MKLRSFNVSIMYRAQCPNTMVVQWLSWIPHLWGQLVCSDTLHKEGFIGLLPDEIIIDILSRLPTNCVLECRKVCKKWLALTSIPYFASKRAAKRDALCEFYHPLTMESRVLHVHQKANCFFNITYLPLGISCGENLIWSLTGQSVLQPQQL
ncbi:hypothetical protein CsSME_00010505 [Camellia sinensis var. sinensis]